MITFTKIIPITSLLLIGTFFSCTARNVYDESKVTFEKEKTITQEEPWRLSSGELVPTEKTEIIDNDLDIYSNELNHLVVALHNGSENHCNGKWLDEACVSWGTTALSQCAQDWKKEIKEAVLLEGSFEGNFAGTLPQSLTIIDVFGKEIPVEIQENGTFEVLVYRGKEIASKRGGTPVKRVSLEPLPNVESDVKLLWQFMPLINFPSSGVTMVKKNDSDIWFAGAITPNSPAEKAGMKAGDTILSLNGHQITGVENDELGMLIDVNPETIIYEYQNCNSISKVTVKRLPSVIFYGANCCGPSGCLAPQNSAKRVTEPTQCSSETIESN